MTERETCYADAGMPGLPAVVASRRESWLGRATGGLIILFMLLDGAVRLVPWPVVTETMDRMGYGSSESLARCLGVISLICAALGALPPASFVGAILTAGYLGGAIASHVRLDRPLLGHVLFGFCLGAMLLGGLWLRNRARRRRSSQFI